MPPPPIDPKATKEPATGSDPFKEADLVNGGSLDDSRRRGPNLFQRITGATRDAKPEAAAPAIAASPSVTRPVPTPKPQETAPQQARLSGVDPEDRVQTSQSDEDLLEIPAFLRRQAN